MFCRIFGYESDDAQDAAATRWIPADASPDDLAGPNDEPLPPAEPSAPVDLAALTRTLQQTLEEPAGLALFRGGRLESVITRALTLRQRLLVDFLQPQGFGWTRGWLLALALIVAAHGLRAIGLAGALPIIIALGGVGGFALPLFGGNWLGFSSSNLFQARIGLNSFAPIGFWEIARLLVSCAALRSIAALPLIALAIRAGFASPSPSWVQTADWSLRALILVLAVQPIWIIAGFSKNSNDSSARGWFTLLLVLTLLAGLIVTVPAAVVFFAADKPINALLAGALLLGFTYGGLLFYGVAYNRGIFDLVAAPRPN
jgi:hypothetical protein